MKMEAMINTKVLPTRLATAVEGMLPEIRSLIEAARHRAVTSANLSLVFLYWDIGRVINTGVQRGPGRADYGSQLMERLAIKLSREYGRGFSAPNLWDMKRFHSAFQILQPVDRESPILSPAARASRPVAKAPDSPALTEDSLLVDFSKHFHLGWTHYRILLGIADPRQRRFYYFLDLLFYHRTLRCLVAVDLKIGTFVAADKGQMDLYLSWLKRHEWREHENEPVGLVLCTSKKRQHIELLLAGGPHKMQVSEYLTKLPDKKVLEERLKLYGRMLEEGEPAK